MMIPEPPPSAMVPVASVPMKLPSITASLPDSRSTCEELQRLITRPRMVTVPGLEALDTTTQSTELEPSISISGTASIAPVALVFGCEPELRKAVDRERRRDEREASGRHDRVDPAARDVERDRVGIGIRVRLVDRGAQRAGAAGGRARPVAGAGLGIVAGAVGGEAGRPRGGGEEPDAGGDQSETSSHARALLRAAGRRAP